MSGVLHLTPNKLPHDAALAIDIKLRGMVSTPIGHEACHNCRRRRLKCDRALPKCLKCIEKGQECLGYQRLFRWEQGVASRGKMAGMTYEQMTKGSVMQRMSSPQSRPLASPPSLRSTRESTEVSSLGSLTDPLIQDVHYASRKYLFYCELVLAVAQSEILTRV